MAQGHTFDEVRREAVDLRLGSAGSSLVGGPGCDQTYDDLDKADPCWLHFCLPEYQGVSERLWCVNESMSGFSDFIFVFVMFFNFYK